MLEGDGARRGDQDVPGWRQEGCDLLEVAVTDEAPPGAGTIVVVVEQRESHFRECLGGVHSYSRGCSKAYHAASA